MTTLAANPATFTSKFAPMGFHHHNHVPAYASSAAAADATAPPQGARAVSDDAVNLFVNYLPLTVDDAQLLQRFAQHGRVLSAKIMRHICTDAPRAAALGTDAAPVQKSKGYGFVLMASRDEAKAAIAALHAAQWDNKKLVVQVAQRLPADSSVPERSQPEAPPVAGRPPTKAVASASAVAAAPVPTVTVGKAAGPGFPVTVSPVDARCTVPHLAAVLEAYGTVTGAEISADSQSATVTFATAAGAREAVRWLHGCRVPQIAARSVLTVTSPAERNSQAKRSSERRRPARRSELVPTAATYRVNDRTMPPPPLHRPMPSLDAPTCDHGPYCQCGEGRSHATKQPARGSAVDRGHRMPTRSDSDAAIGSAPSARAMLGGAPAPSAVRHHDPYHVAPQYAEPLPPAAPAASAYQSTGSCAAGCQYCSSGTTVILQNMPTEDALCERVLNQLLGPIGYFKYWECWGDGQAVATFADYAAAAEAVELLNSTEQQVDFYDCDAGLPASHTRRF